MSTVSSFIGGHIFLVMMSCCAMSDSIVNIWLDLSNQEKEFQAQPAWITAEVWLRHCLDYNAVVTGGNDLLRVLARQSSNARQVTLFLRNETTKPMTVRLYSPGTGWKFTCWGREVAEDKADTGFVWKVEPSMPLPLPREMILEPKRLTMVQIADLMLTTIQPDDGKY